MDELSKALIDPVGYIEGHGGVAKFLTTELVPSNDPVDSVQRFAPSVIAALTPLPGTMSTPTTLGGSAGEFDSAVGGSRKGLFIGLGVVVAAAAAIVVVLLSGGKDSGAQRAASTKPSTHSSAGAGSTPSHGPDHGVPGSGDATSGGLTGVTTDAGSIPLVPIPESGAAAGETAMVTVTVASDPSGASVRFGGELKPRGKTPLTFKVPRSNAQVAIEIGLPGFHDQTKTVKLSGDVDLELALKKRTAPGPRPGGGKGGTGAAKGKGKGNCSDADLMDPFATDCK
jgi:hypothetical protein